MRDAGPDERVRRWWQPKLSDIPVIAFFVVIAAATVVIASQLPIPRQVTAVIVSIAACAGAYGLLSSMVQMNTSRKLMAGGASVALVILAVVVWPAAPPISEPPIAAQSDAQKPPSPSAPVPSVTPQSSRTPGPVPAPGGAPPPSSSAPQQFQVQVDSATISYGDYFTVSGSGVPITDEPSAIIVHIYLDQPKAERGIEWPHPNADGTFRVRIFIDSTGMIEPIEPTKYPPFYATIGEHLLIAKVWDGQREHSHSILLDVAG